MRFAGLRAAISPELAREEEGRHETHRGLRGVEAEGMGRLREAADVGIRRVCSPKKSKTVAPASFVGLFLRCTKQRRRRNQGCALSWERGREVREGEMVSAVTRI